MDSATRQPFATDSNEAQSEVLPLSPENDGADNDDADSAIGSQSIATSTDSLSASIFDYRRLHGRPYQKSETTEYWAPVDETQNEVWEIR